MKFIYKLLTITSTVPIPITYSVIYALRQEASKKRLREWHKAFKKTFKKDIKESNWDDWNDWTIPDKYPPLYTHPKGEQKN